MTEPHKIEWEDYRDIYSILYKSTKDEKYKARKDACKRLLKEIPADEPDHTFIQ